MDEHQKLRRNIRHKYSIALSLVFLLITLATYLTQIVIQDQEYDAKTINIAGKQRMLSQKIALQSYRLQSHPTGQELNSLLSDLEQSINLFSDSFNYLLGSDKNNNKLLSDDVRALFNQGTPSLRTRLDNYISAAQSLVRDPSLSSEKTTLFEQSYTESLLDDLNNVVLNIEEEAKDRVRFLSKLELSIWLLALLILILEVVFIFRPLERQVIITLKKLEQKRKQAIASEQAAHKANESKTKFLATMSHELRTPLNGIFGMLQLAQHETQIDDRNQYLKKALDSGRHLLSLINDLLDLAKMEENRLDVSPTNTDIESLVSSTLLPFSLACQKKDIKFEHLSPNPAPKWVKVDAKKLRQIINNLVGNAVKFTHTGKVVVTTLFSVNKGHFDLMLEIADTGIGIGQKNQADIFKRFNQADSNIDRQYGGTGLGLAITKELAELMEGNISFSSDIGKGSVFTVKLPLGKPDDDIILTSKNQDIVTQNLAEALGKLNILVAEDNDINAEIIEHTLHAEGHVVRHVTDGHRAVEEVRNGSYDLILMDINMPNMDGIQAAKEIRKTLKLTLPIIAITANSYDKDIQAAKDAGMDHYLTKPIERNNLIQTVNTLAVSARASTAG